MDIEGTWEITELIAMLDDPDFEVELAKRLSEAAISLYEKSTKVGKVQRGKLTVAFNIAAEGQLLTIRPDITTKLPPTAYKTAPFFVTKNGLTVDKDPVNINLR
jgi:hypothetical protein